MDPQGGEGGILFTEYVSCWTSLGHPFLAKAPNLLLSFFPGWKCLVEWAAEGRVQVELVQGKRSPGSIVETCQLRRSKVTRGVVKPGVKGEQLSPEQAQQVQIDGT